MQVFRLNRIFWKICGIQIECGNHNSFYVIYNIFIKAFTIISLSLLMVFSLLLLIYDEQAQDSFIFTAAILQIVCPISLIGPYVWLISKTNRLHDAFIHLKSIVDKRISIVNEQIYQKAENKSEYVSKWPVLLCLVGYTVFYFTMTVGNLILDLIHGNIDPLSWFNIYYLR